MALSTSYRRKMITAILMFLFTVAVCRNYQIHHRMTRRELQAIFRVSNRSLVPVHEVVAVLHTLEERRRAEDHRVELVAFNRTMKLHLQPNEGILYGVRTPVFTVGPDKSQPHGVKYVKVLDPFKDLGKPYQDVQTQSAVMLNKMPDDSLRMSGNILNDFVIEPLPQRLEGILRKKRVINQMDESFERIHHHIIYKRSHSTNDKIPQEMGSIRGLHEQSDLDPEGSSPPAPDVIYPEILVIMDYALYKTQKTNLKTALTYLLAHWNAVDLRYRAFSSPRIQLNIAAFVISTAPGGTPFLEKTVGENSAVDADVAIVRMSQHLFEEPQIPSSGYDLAVAMTRFDLYNIRENIRYTETLGYGRECGACSLDTHNKRMTAVAIIEDNGGFSSIFTTAHEVGHLLGSPHDGSSTAEECDEHDGYLMSSVLTLQTKSHQWSQCSRKKIQKFVNSKAAACLYSIPNSGPPLRKILPGELLSLQQQCEKYGSTLCERKANFCMDLWCFDPRIKICLPHGPAAEGSSCGEDMHCMNGQCVSRQNNES